MKYSTPLKHIISSMRARVVEGDHGIHQRTIIARLDELAAAVVGLETLAQRRDPTETEAKHASRVADAAKKLEAKIATIDSRIQETAREGSNALDREVVANAKLTENGFAQEIRAAVRGMSDKQRMAALQSAVESGDAATVAALTGAPGIVTGLEAEFTTRMKEAYRERHGGPAYGALAELLDAWPTAVQAVGVARNAASAAVDPSYVADIQRAQAMAQAAQSEFDQAIG